MKFFAFLARQFRAVRIVITTILPMLLRTGRRPIILEKYSGIGDIICTFPAAEELKKRHPGAPVVYNCHPGYVCLPKLWGITDQVVSELEMGVACHWFRFLIAGFYQFASDDDRPNVIPHQVYIKDFAQTFGLSVPDEHPGLTIPPPLKQHVEKIVQTFNIGESPLILLHPGPSWTVREWPNESWCQLVAQLREAGYTNIAHLGTTQVLAFGEVEVPGIPGTTSLINRLSLEETIGLIARASLFIGIDSGLLHIAASTRTPSVGIWGPTFAHLRFNPRNARSFVSADVPCSGCQHVVPRLHWMTGCPHDIACMKSISVEAVLEACLTRLAETV